MKTIFFEHLAENPEREVKDLCDFLNIEFHREMLNVDVQFSAGVDDEGKHGIVKSVADRWKKELSKTEIFLAEKILRSQMAQLGYPLTNARPSVIKLVMYLLFWPLQLSIAFVLNLGRMGNPFQYIAKRLFQGPVVIKQHR